MTAASSSPRHDSSVADLVARRARVLGPAYRLFYDEPLHLVRGEGVWLHAADGTRYLDAYNNVASVGHCHPHVVEAIARQAAQLNTHTRYLHEDILRYAERLLATMPPALGHAMFTCTGSEANDLAMRIARSHTQADGLIVTDFAYHGVTAAIAEASPSLGRHAKLGAHVRTVPAPDSYRIPPERLGAVFAEGVRAAIGDLRVHGMRPAALLVDTVFSSDGIFTHPPGFLCEAVQAVRAEGGLFIADEVQPGLGRTGEALWGFQRHDLAPDIVTMGKPLGNGHPIAGLTVQPRVLEAFGRECRYFNTFGGNPVSVAAGMAVLDIIERDDLVANALRVGRHLKEKLSALARRHALIGDVRGSGLFVAVEFVTDRAARSPASAEAARIVNGLRDRRVLVGATGPHANALKIRPPLVFCEADADMLVEALDDTLTAVSSGAIRRSGTSSAC